MLWRNLKTLNLHEKANKSNINDLKMGKMQGPPRGIIFELGKRKNVFENRV